MTPQAFIAKWRDNPLTERAGAQAHFEDLCALLEVEPPRIEGEYQYERGLIKKSSASQGWADVWKRGCFAWEYKAPDKDLGAALKQLMVYGGLFETIEVPPLTTEDVVQLLDAARMGWGEIEPAILGTLFERGLNPDMRSQLGAHYTDPATILKLIRPVIEAPLLEEWAEIRTKLTELAPKFKLVKSKGKGKFTPNAERLEAQALFGAVQQRLKAYRVLDPACGSGNFLYLALKTLKDIEHRTNLEAEALGLQRELTIETSPANVLGIELNPYAAELARVTVWIGEIQWMLTHGYPVRRDPILRPLDHIENRDAVLTTEGGEPNWPRVDAIVGNPPFLGGSKKRGELGDDYFNALNSVYQDRVPGGADLVTYWFEKARAHIEAGKAQRAGLVATNSIRGGANRKVLERILKTAPIFEAWSDEAWINNGAAVRVSLVCFGDEKEARLDGQPVAEIHADLTAGNETSGALDLTLAKQLMENSDVCFQGASKKAKFEIAGEIARTWLKHPNPHGKQNSDVVRPWSNGISLMRNREDLWIIDYGTTMRESDAALYETPFQYVAEHIKPERMKNNRETYRKYWWRLAEPRPGLRTAIRGHERYIATVAHSKYRLFAWLHNAVSPDQALIVITRADDTTFGILHSRFHELWSLRLGTSLEDRPRYTPTTTFETFPFPAGLTPRDTAAAPERASPTCYAEAALAENIARAAAYLNTLREAWLNPPEWVDWVRTKEEEQAGFPLRPVAKPGHEAELKKRTLTKLYNVRPAWLDNAHRELDAAVAAAYGWTDYTPEMPDEEILRRLLALNLERAEIERQLEIGRKIMKEHHAVLRELAK